jgi:ParB family chromosome partitioning protein
MTEFGPEAKGGAPRRRGLGMGLSALLGTATDQLPAVTGERPRMVPIEFLRPCPLQPRRRFAEDDLAALAESIRHRGVIQPLLVRRTPDGADFFEIVAGERRWRAAQMAGAHELPVIVHELSDRDALEVAVLENVQRQDLTPLEEAEGYRRLIEEFEHTQEALASALGKSRSHIANLLRLLGLPAEVRALLERGELSAGHARALLGARDPVGLANTVVSRGLNVRQTEALVRADAQHPRRRRSLPAPKDPNTAALERDLSSRLGLPVSLTPNGAGGMLRIAYHSLDQLDGLIRRLS